MPYRAFWSSLSSNIEDTYHRSSPFPETFTKGHDIVVLLLILSHNQCKSSKNLMQLRPWNFLKCLPVALMSPLDILRTMRQSDNYCGLCSINPVGTHYFVFFSKAIYAHLSSEANYEEGISQCHFIHRQEIVIAVKIMDCELEFRGCFRNAVL